MGRFLYQILSAHNRQKLKKFVLRIKNFFLPIQLLFVPQKHQAAIEKLKKNEKTTVAFFVLHRSIWKYKDLYVHFSQHARFNPVVIICPYTAYGEEHMLDEMNATYDEFVSNGYNTIKTFNEKSGKWLDVKQVIQPGIIFFTNPHPYSRQEYLITNFPKTLTCYVPYAFVVIHLLDMHYNQPFHKLLWKHFVETDFHQKTALSYLPKGYNNVTVSGFTSLDIFLSDKPTFKDVWKIKYPEIKRIIWAPHHTIDDDKDFLSYSNFLEDCEFMLQLPAMFSNKIQIAFKPHPLLKPKLYHHEDWGEEKTHAYYARWKNMSNGMLQEGEYEHLFGTSDAMILDSASFMAEYMATQKPSLFTKRDDQITDRFNNLGKEIFNNLYTADNQEDIKRFVEDVVLLQKDEMFEQRMTFFNAKVAPPNHTTASRNITNEIEHILFS